MLYDTKILRYIYIDNFNTVTSVFCSKKFRNLYPSRLTRNNINGIYFRATWGIYFAIYQLMNVSQYRYRQESDIIIITVKRSTVIPGKKRIP